MEGVENYELPPAYRPEKKKRKMVQPTKDYLRAELKLAELEIEALQLVIERLRSPWWIRAWSRLLADGPLPVGHNPPPPAGPKPPPPPNPPGLYQPLPAPDLPCNPPPRRP